jgi:flagellar biosynthesis regulator FlbT
LCGKSNKQIAYQQQELSLASYNNKSNIIQAQRECKKEKKIYFLIMVVKMDHESKKHTKESWRDLVMLPIAQQS